MTETTGEVVAELDRIAAEKQAAAEQLQAEIVATRGSRMTAAYASKQRRTLEKLRQVIEDDLAAGTSPTLRALRSQQKDLIRRRDLANDRLARGAKVDAAVFDG